MAVGCVIVLIVAATSKDLSMASAWEGIRLIFGGLFSTGRTAAGTLTFGFNPTKPRQYAIPRDAAHYDGPFCGGGIQDWPVQHRCSGTVFNGYYGYADAGSLVFPQNLFPLA